MMPEPRLLGSDLGQSQPLQAKTPLARSFRAGASRATDLIGSDVDDVCQSRLGIPKLLDHSVRMGISGPQARRISRAAPPGPPLIPESSPVDWGGARL